MARKSRAPSPPDRSALYLGPTQDVAAALRRDGAVSTAAGWRGVRQRSMVHGESGGRMRFPGRDVRRRLLPRGERVWCMPLDWSFPPFLQGTLWYSGRGTQRSPVSQATVGPCPMREERRTSRGSTPSPHCPGSGDPVRPARSPLRLLCVFEPDFSPLRSFSAFRHGAASRRSPGAGLPPPRTTSACAAGSCRSCRGTSRRYCPGARPGPPRLHSSARGSAAHSPGTATGSHGPPESRERYPFPPARCGSSPCRVPCGWQSAGGRSPGKL